MRGANLLGLKSRILRRVTPKRFAALPLPAIIGLKSGSFALLAVGGSKDRVRVIDPILRTTREFGFDDLPEIATGEALLVTRRLGGAGVDPNTFGFRWFLPSLLRYRKSLRQVIVASLFLQMFALATPIFFQLVVDKVLVHKGLSTLVVLIIGMVSLGLFRERAAVPAHLYAEPHHQPRRRRTRPPAVPSPVPPAARPISRRARRARRSRACANSRRSAAS